MNFVENLMNIAEISKNRENPGEIGRNLVKIDRGLISFKGKIGSYLQQEAFTRHTGQSLICYWSSFPKDFSFHAYGLEKHQ